MRALAPAVRGGWRITRHQPAFALYLAALFAFGIKWLSPFEAFYERALVSDGLIAASAAVWAWERLRTGVRWRIRAFHIALAVYLVAGLVSMSFAADHEFAAKNVLLMFELAVLAVLTSEFASLPERLNVIVWVIVLLSLYTAALALIGLGLFYADIHTSLLGAYGKLTPSEAYARVAGGFQSGPLLSSFCIFASAVVAREDVTLPRRLQLATQAVLAILVVLTFSRAVVGFAAALVIRAAARRRDSRAVRIVAVTFVVASVGVIAALSAGRLHLDPSNPATVHYEFPDPGGRRANFAASLETLGEHPLVGQGPGSLPGRRGLYRAHSTPLNIAATMGLPALVAATFLILVLWHKRRRPTNVSIWSGLVGLGIDALAQDVDHFRHVWMMLGFADADRERGIDTAPEHPAGTQ